MKVMCAHCGSPNLDTDAACYDCGKPPVAGSDNLPADFPGHAALTAAGITTYEQLKAIPDLTEISGIGEATAKMIAEALSE
jgi:hypothetical protein